MFGLIKLEGPHSVAISRRQDMAETNPSDY